MSAASVDIDADKIKSSIRTDNDPGTTFAIISGIKASTIGLPFEKAAGVVSGERKNLVVAPVKYAIPVMIKANPVEAYIPILIERLSLIA